MIDFTEISMDQIESILIETRENKNLSQTEVGEQLGIKRSRMSVIESNMAGLSTETFLKLVKALGGSLNFELDDEENLKAGKKISLTFIDNVIHDWRHKKIDSATARKKLQKLLNHE